MAEAKWSDAVETARIRYEAAKRNAEHAEAYAEQTKRVLDRLMEEEANA